MRITLALLNALLLPPLAALGADTPGVSAPRPPQKNLPLPGEVFLVAGHTAFIIPAKADPARRSRPWVWYAPTLPGLPGPEERWMFERFVNAGIAIAGLDVGESYGSPAGNDLFTEFHATMTASRGYASKPVLLGRSRGGLMTLSWAAGHPEKVAAFAGIYPVCNLASYPGVARAAGAYGMTPEELQAHLTEHNPIDRVAALAKAGVPLFAIHGDADTVVPLEANSGLLKERFTASGGAMQLIVPPGQGHNMWPGFFQSQELVDFVTIHARSGLTLTSPLDYQVIQRASRDAGTLVIRGGLNHPEAKTAVIQARLITEGRAGEWRQLVARLDQAVFNAELEAPAGGWHRLEVRAVHGAKILGESAVEPVGVGEVFVVAGQSNSANHGEAKQNPTTGFVSTFDGHRWRPANDPQPGAGGSLGSFMPPFGDGMAEQFRVPVGIVACGVGASSVREWLPKGATFPNAPTLTGHVTQRASGEWESKGTIFASFVARMQSLGRRGFRAVLWHQGESDANQQDPTRTLPGHLYREYLERLIRDSQRGIGWDAPWFVAQASYHAPGDEASPEIRAAQQSLWTAGVALEGPDTDTLRGELRDHGGLGVHFSGKGLREHAALWVNKVAPWLEAQLAVRRPSWEVANPANVLPATPQGAPGYPSRDPNLDALPGFQNPPPGYGEVPFWWWTGDPLDKDRLLWQIDELHRQGVSGMQVNYAHEDSAGWPTYAAEPAIFSDAWWDIWKFVAGECGKRGMGIGLSGYTLDWPNGKSLISRTIYSDPEIQGREIAVARKERVAAGQAFSTEWTPDTVAVRAYPIGATGIGPGSLDLARHVQNQRVEWRPAEGRWEVWIFIAPRKAGTLNPIHPLAGQRVIEKFYQPFQDHAPNQSAAGLNYFFHDELQFGVGDRVWADDLAEEFNRRKGYDLFEALPAMFEEMGSRTVKGRLDFMDVKMQLAQERYFIPIFNWHWSRGKIYGCDQGSRGRNPLEFGDYFSSVRWYTAPGHDTPGGKADLIKGKVSSSIAHLYQRPRVWLEGYHSLGWGATPENLMFATRENYLYGCNLLNLHGLYYTTHGSFWEWAPPCYHFRMPYWQHMGTFLKYFERLSYLMSQGIHQCDVAVMYPVAPGQAGLGGPEAIEAAFAAGATLMNGGCDFIFMDSESLARAEVRNGRLHVADASYRVLILPVMRAARWTTLLKAREFLRDGGIVIAGGALPEASDRAGREDPLLDELVRELFGATAAECATGVRPSVQRTAAGGIGLALLPGEEVPARRYDGGFVGRWAWAKEPAQQVHFKTVWRAPSGEKSTCNVRFFCDNEGALFVNDRRICADVDYSGGWSGQIELRDGDVITIDARDHDAPGHRGTAGMFLALVQDGRTVLSTEDLRYTLAPPAGDGWRTNRNLAGLLVPDCSNVHALHRGRGASDVWAAMMARLEDWVPRDVRAAPGVRAVHRKIGPRDVYLVMGAPRNSMVEFRAKGRVELWDPWTGHTRSLLVRGETAAGTQVELPLEDYEAQIVVFNPNQPHVNPPMSQPIPKQKIALDGEWEFELKPTMDNRFGDFRLPITETVIGPEARIFRHAVESGDASAWHQPDFDDRQWERVTHDFGPQFWLLGPLPVDAAKITVERELAGRTHIDPLKAIQVAGKALTWRPYSFSWRSGLEGDPGHQGWHGLKENITDHFLCLGKRANALNEFKYEPEPEGSRYYLWTSATVDHPTTARILTSVRQAGVKPHASEVLSPAVVFLNGEPVADLQKPVALRAGANPILIRYDHAGRGFFVLKRASDVATPVKRPPLAMTWFDDPTVIRFDVHAGVQPAEWFRFTAPPGLRAMRIAARGTVEAWASGQPMLAVASNRFETSKPLSGSSVVALRVRPETGFGGGAIFPEPIRLECGPGVMDLGDWSKQGVLECYSGGAWYRKTMTLALDQSHQIVTLDLGKVVATAEVHVNGALAGIRVAPPWRVDISGMVKAGANRIEVLVFNTLANHYQTIPTRYRGEPTSGLLGPVTLEIASPSPDSFEDGK